MLDYTIRHQLVPERCRYVDVVGVGDVVGVVGVVDVADIVGVVNVVAVAMMVEWRSLLAKFEA